MWEMIGSFAFWLFKFYLEKRAGRKLNDKELTEAQIIYTKERTGNVVKQTKDFKANMEKLLKDLEAEESGQGTNE